MSKRIRGLRSPSTEWRRRFTRIARWPFARLNEGQKFWLGFVCVCLGTTLLVQNPFWRTSAAQAYKEGDIARETIISPADISIVDPDEFERVKGEARNSVKPIFRYEANKPEQTLQGFLSSWEKLQRHGGTET